MAQTFMQATGKVTYAIISSMLEIFIVFLPILYLMNKAYGVYGIAFSHAVTMVFTIVITLVLAIKWSREIKNSL